MKKGLLKKVKSFRKGKAQGADACYGSVMIALFMPVAGADEDSTGSLLAAKVTG